MPQCLGFSVGACRDWPRRATHFLCFAKESKQRKATLVRSPLRGYPKKCRGWREAQNSPAAQTTALLNPPSPAFFRLRTRDLTADTHPHPNPPLEGEGTDQVLAQVVDQLLLQRLRLQLFGEMSGSDSLPFKGRVRVGMGLKRSLVTTPKERAQNRKKKRRCLSRRRVSALPDFAPALLGTPKGRRRQGRLFCLLFWRSKKVSGPPGPVPASIYGEQTEPGHRRDILTKQPPPAPDTPPA